jgi:magnesium-transporting ATPase (P-type)
MAQVSLEKLLEIMEAKDKGLVDELGGLQILAESIGSDLQNGLLKISDHDLDLRKQKYGINKMERKPPPSIFELFMDAMKDTTIIVLLIAAMISILIGAISCSIHLGKTCPRKPLWDIGYTPGNEVSCLTCFVGNKGRHFDFLFLSDDLQKHSEGACLEWAEGLAVFLACMIVGTITALNNYKKELQFRALQAKQDDSLTTVWRAGAPLQVSINDICVGDVVQLDTGAKIPAGTPLLKTSYIFLLNSKISGRWANHQVLGPKGG